MGTKSIRLISLQASITMLTALCFQSCLKKEYIVVNCNTRTILHSDPVSIQAQKLAMRAALVNQRAYTPLLNYDSTKTRFANPPDKYRERFVFTFDTIAGRKVLTMAPRLGASGKYLLFIHGGGYALNLGEDLYEFYAQVVEKSGITMVIPDYGLAPYHNYIQGYGFIQAVYDALRSRVGVERVMLGGDSAGGGFALGFTQKQSLEGNPLPYQLLLISPWLDITLSNPDLENMMEIGLNAYALREAGLSWAGPNINPQFYQLSPINGPLHGLPKINIFIGGRDMFLPDLSLLRSKMSDSCAALEVYEYPQMFHVWMALHTHLPESKKAIAEIVEICKK